MVENFFVGIVVCVLLGGTGARMMVRRGAVLLRSYRRTTTGDLSADVMSACSSVLIPRCNCNYYVTAGFIHHGSDCLL